MPGDQSHQRPSYGSGDVLTDVYGFDVLAENNSARKNALVIVATSPGRRLEDVGALVWFADGKGTVYFEGTMSREQRMALNLPPGVVPDTWEPLELAQRSLALEEAHRAAEQPPVPNETSTRGQRLRSVGRWLIRRHVRNARYRQDDIEWWLKRKGVPSDSPEVQHPELDALRSYAQQERLRELLRGAKRAYEKSQQTGRRGILIALDTWFTDEGKGVLAQLRNSGIAFIVYRQRPEVPENSGS